VRQTFHKGHDANRKSFEAMISTFTPRTVISVAFLLAPTLIEEITNSK
jgi:hypothetical protein